MNKREFLKKLRKGISSMPRQEMYERLHFYSEMIDDMVEEGISEEEAVSAVGSAEEIAAEILSAAEVKNTRSMKGWETFLLILGAPLWVPLMISFLAVLLSLYISMWTVVISLWAVFASLAGCMIGGICGGIVCAISGNVIPGIALIGAGIVCAGLVIYVFFGCRWVTVATVRLAKWCISSLKERFSKKEAA